MPTTYSRTDTNGHHGLSNKRGFVANGRILRPLGRTRKDGAVQYKKIPETGQLYKLKPPFEKRKLHRTP